MWRITIFLVAVSGVLGCGSSKLLEASDAGIGSLPRVGDAMVARMDASSMPASDSGTSSTCPTTVDTLESTLGVSLVEGPLPCEASDASEFQCAIYKARIETPAVDVGPIDDPSLDDDLWPAQVMLTIRAPRGDALCFRRWVVFDAGGFGFGYASHFGHTALGQYEPGGAGYGDDLIHDYNVAGYVTVDLAWGCNDSCVRSDLKDWAPPQEDSRRGSSWYLNTNGTGMTGVASRARAVYEWAYHNGGDNRICAHAHSSGSGRLIATMTRFETQNWFESVVFEGGPVSLHTPWLCGATGGSLGDPPSGFQPSFMYQRHWDCAMSEAPNDRQCNVGLCKAMRYDSVLSEQDSIYARAVNRTFEGTDIHVVIGGADASPAFKSAFYWLAGYPSYGIEGLRARSIHLHQGFCSSVTGTFQDGMGTHDCSEWDPSHFSGVSQSDVGYEPRLSLVEHSVVESQAGEEVSFEVGQSTCLPL